MATKTLSSFVASLELNNAKFLSGLAEAKASAQGFSQDVKNKISPLQGIFDGLWGASMKLIGWASVAKVAYDLAKSFEAVEKASGELNASIMQSRLNGNDYTKVAETISNEMLIPLQDAVKITTLLANKTNLVGDSFKDAAKQAAALQKLGAGDVTGSSIAAIKRWGGDTSNLEAYNNFIYTVSKNSGMGPGGIAQLNQELIQSSNTLREFGFSVSESANFLGDLHKAGYDVDTELSGLQKMINNVLKKNPEHYRSMQEVWEALKTKVDAATGSFNKMEAATKFFGGKGVGAEEFVKIFGDANVSFNNASTASEKIQENFGKTVTYWDKIVRSVGEAKTGFALLAKEWAKPFAEHTDKPYTFPQGAGGLNIGENSFPELDALGISGHQKNNSFTVSYQQEVTKATESTDKLSKSIDNSFNSWANLKKPIDEATKALLKWNQTDTDKLQSSMTSSFTNFFMSLDKGFRGVGKSFESMALGIIQDIQKIIIEEQISQPIAKMLSAGIGGWISGVGLGGSNGASIMANPGSAASLGFGSFPKPYADGGSYSGGPMIVGEEGPELMIPSSSGTIIPNGSFGGDTHNHISVNIQNAAGDNAITSAVHRGISTALRAVPATMADSRRRGGVATRQTGL